MLRRAGAGWTTRRLLELLDPSGFVLLVAHADAAATLDASIAGAISKSTVPIHVIELAPAPGEAGERYRHELGASPSAFLVRPDGYVAVASRPSGAPRAIEAFVGRWLAGHEEQANLLTHKKRDRS